MTIDEDRMDYAKRRMTRIAIEVWAIAAILWGAVFIVWGLPS